MVSGFLFGYASAVNKEVHMADDDTQKDELDETMESNDVQREETPDTEASRLDDGMD